MRGESHRYRGVRRPSRGAGWGHRAVYVGAALATAALVTGFALAGYYFGSFSHVFNKATANGNENAPYGVQFLTEYATYASLISNFNFTNGTSGPCANVTANGTNQLNASSMSPGVPLNLSMSNSTDSVNATTTFVCMDAINNANITYLWQFVNGTFVNDTNYTGWDMINVSANDSAVMGNGSFNESLYNLTGNANLTNNWINETGCLPVLNNTTFASGAASRCAFFDANNNTTFMPHGGFFAPNGTWINETTNASPDPWYWEPNQTGYLPSDVVFQASIGFDGNISNMTYEVVASFQYASPIPQVVFVNTGNGENETLTFVFDMSAAWTTALPGSDYGYTNATDGYFSAVVAEIGTVSITVYQCYADATGATVCPGTLGGTTFP
jgi:hypothetical protein